MIMGTHRSSGVVLVLVAGLFAAGCGDQSESVSSSLTTAEPPGVSETTAVSSPASDSDLNAFRQAAADAPYWYTVDWFPPSSIEQIARGAHGVVVGRVRSARVDDPRADDLRPYEGAPTLYWFEVVVDVEVTRVASGQADGEVVQVRIPVLASGFEGLDSARPAADRIVAATPTDALGVFTIGEAGAARPVALMSSTGNLLGYYSSMDSAVEDLGVDQLADELGAAATG
jgi:hypothetical protein